MNDPRHPLTPEVQRTICSYIMAGGFPQVAAEAAGIPAKTFDYWMRCGNAQRPQPLYRNFREAVLQAQAYARIVAEGTALKRAPLSWLRYGPGKETKRLTGWTDGVKPQPIKRDIMNAGLGKFWELIPVMLEALTPFPEARIALADALEKHDMLPKEDDGNPDEAPPTAPVPPPQTQPQSQAQPELRPEPSPVGQAVPDSTPQDAPAGCSEPVTPVQQTVEQSQEIQGITCCEPATKVQPPSIEPAIKMQRNDNEKALNKPPPTPRKKWDPNLGLPDSAWTRIL